MDRTPLRQQLMRQHLTPLLLLACGFPLLMAGCDSSPGEDYQTFSEADADRVDEAREESDRESEKSGDVATASALNTEVVSEIVLAAAQTAARAVPAPSASKSTTSPSPQVTSPVATATNENDEQAAPNDPAAIGPPKTMAELLAQVAGEKAANLVEGEPLIREIKLLVPERSFKVEGPQDALRVSYDDLDLLKILNMEPVPPNAVDFFPKWLSDLDGKQVRVRGFMYPTFQETGIPAFVLARDNQICCFGRKAKIYDLIEVTMSEGKTTDYIQNRPFDVVGTFHIRPDYDDKWWQLFQIEDAIVIDD